MFIPYSLFNTLTGIEIENEDIILLPRNNGENFALNIQNSPLKEKFYNLSFQQGSKVHVQIRNLFSLNIQDRTRLVVDKDKPVNLVTNLIWPVLKSLKCLWLCSTWTWWTNPNSSSYSTGHLSDTQGYLLNSDPLKVIGCQGWLTHKVISRNRPDMWAKFPFPFFICLFLGLSITVKP